MANELPEGLYESLITEALQTNLLKFDLSRVHIGRASVEPAEAPERFARHLARVVATGLRQVPEDEREAKVVAG